jgi:hypothetical protein
MKKLVVASVLALAVIAASRQSASAWDDCHHCGLGFYIRFCCTPNCHDCYVVPEDSGPWQLQIPVCYPQCAPSYPGAVQMVGDISSLGGYPPQWAPWYWYSR